ncbi:zinc-ribbon and DUF3426 domain-containing protein [Variovorax sp. MHTC-1]|uniref:zinc-ribbon and DUF3426 domain-containing protein n=1 Tax=Variovorax sp. MHTC-1 TaxID=2495593 RepID=UPI000F88BDB2|nr:zinc-ribbon and DUF3426 domain-containing protein [Variovorax sp. MHTC-1]RST54484.1 DUF3426 domain-containing protein [Variovorax sp. MHTC-1]
MSLVTRCPACSTTFKVVKDQLRISDGWVRCGRCSEVFDATVDLHEAPDAAAGHAAVAPTSAAGEGISVQPAAEPPIETEPEEAAEPPGDEEPVRNLEEADFLDDEQEIEPPLAEPPVAAPPPPAPKTSTSSDALSLAVGVVADEPWPQRSQPTRAAEAQVVPPYPSLPPFPNIDLSLPAAPPIGREPPPPRPSPPPPPVAEDDTGNAQLQKALRRARAKSAKIARAKARGEERAARESAPVVLAASEPEPAIEPARRSARFSDGAEGSAFWQRPAVRRSLIAAAVLAALLLLVQVLHQERDLIAARQPALRPALAALCSLTGCELSALRQIGDITIDGASFAREKSGDAYRLSFTLRNAAAVPLAMPAVELSLLDMQERAVIRRVLMPAEFGAPTVLPARAERAASLPLALTGPEAAALPPIAGYRVLAFYP